MRLAKFLGMCVLMYIGALAAALPLAAQSTALTFVPGSSVKLYQVIGDCDWVQWDATITSPTPKAAPTCNPTASKTATNADVLGDDVPVVFEHNGEMIVTFGDTIGPDGNYFPKWSSFENSFVWGAHDPIAHSTTQNAADGLNLNFYLSGTHALEVLPTVQPDGTTVFMGTDDIPIAGISINGQIYVAVSTGNVTVSPGVQDASHDYSVLTMFNEATQVFSSGRTISAMPNGHFVRPVFYQAAPGLLGEPAPVAAEPVTLIFGVGKGSAGVYLSVIPSNDFWTGTDAGGNPATRYFTGLAGGQPIWSASESAAVPVVLGQDPTTPTIQNASVFYSQPLGLWIMMFQNTGRQSGMYVTYAAKPWGPWSAPQLTFNECRDNGYGNFMFYYYATAAQNICPTAMPAGVTSAPNSSGPSGPTIALSSNDPATTRGFAYAPALIERFATVAGSTLKLYYMMSTWNPYTTVMMESDFTIAGCQYSISTNGLAFSGAGGTGTINITTAAGCPWTIGGLPSWVVLTSPASGTGNGTVSFQVLANTGTNQSASFAIAGQVFTVDQQASTIPGLSFIGSMPHLAAEGGWLTTFTFVNKSSSAQTARTSLFSPAGAALPLPILLLQQPAAVDSTLASSLDQSIAANAQFVLQATGPANVPYFEGSAQLTATGNVDGFAIFHYNPTNQEAVVPMETRTAASYILPFDNTNGVLTGVAIENIAAQAATIPVIIRKDSGSTVGTGTIALNALGHTSFVLSTQFPSTANIRGTVEFDTPLSGNAQISVLGIRYTGGTLTTIPVLANVANTLNTPGGLMAHLASGDGWQTTFALVNTGGTAAQATLKFYGDSGTEQSLPLTVLESGATSTATFVTQVLGPNASLWIQSAAPATSALLSGSAVLATTGNVSGYAIFRYNPNGQEAVVPLESRNAGAYLIAFDNTNNTTTGVAINATQNVSVPVTLRDDQGNILATSSIALNANGHTSFLLATQYPQTAGLRGTAEFDTPGFGTSSPAKISVLGIRSPPALTFTTLPALAK